MWVSLASSSCDTPAVGNVTMKKLIERWAFLTLFIHKIK